MSDYSLKNNIIRLSKEAGFSICRFCDAKPLDSEIDRFEKQVSLLFGDDAKYLTRNIDKRRDPANILNGAKSVIVLATNYFSGDLYKNEPGAGKISRYALGMDYHDILKNRAKTLCREIREKVPDLQYYFSVDTGPVLEKAWAELSGLGWRGKNGLIISPEFGTWIFLTIIYVDIYLPPDKPIENECGKCNICRTMCPTGALDVPFVVEPKKCVSYWTIESKTEFFPERIRKNLRGRLYGCDVCQEVCPWNKKRQKVSADPAFRADRFPAEFNLERVLAMSEEEFREIFRKNPIKRLKLSGLKRNARELTKNSIK